MTVQEAISQVDALCPNRYTIEDKVRWLNEVDARIDKEILSKYEEAYEGGLPYTYTPYTVSDLSTRLLAPAPYSTMYVYYLQSRINYADNETDRYNNSSAMFNQAYFEFGNYFNSTQKALRHNLHFF